MKKSSPSRPSQIGHSSPRNPNIDIYQNILVRYLEFVCTPYTVVGLHSLGWEDPLNAGRHFVLSSAVTVREPDSSLFAQQLLFMALKLHANSSCEISQSLFPTVTFHQSLEETHDVERAARA